MNDIKSIYTVTQLKFNDLKTYTVTASFAIGSLVFPQIFHLIPNGGEIFIPIYFFTLIASYKFGIIPGIILSVLSPLLNYIIFSMPPEAMLPEIIFNSIILAICASLTAKSLGKVSITGTAIAVITTQAIGLSMNIIIRQPVEFAFFNVVASLPGILLQIFGGYLVLLLMSKIRF